MTLEELNDEASALRSRIDRKKQPGLWAKFQRFLALLTAKELW